MGVIVAIYFFCTQVGFPIYDELTAAADTVLEREDQLRRYRRAVVRKANYVELLVDASQRVQEGEALLIRGDNPSLASAELQSIVEQVVELTGIELGQRNISAARQKDEFFNEITMTLGFESTPGQLVAFLEQLRGLEKLVTVRSIQISPLQAMDDVPEGEALVKDVRVSLTVGAVLASAPVAEPVED